MVVWFFVGALCKRPWRWKRLNCYVAACAAFFVAVPRFFAGHSPCAPDAGNLFPHPSFRTVEHVFPYSIFCLRATRIWYIDPQDGVNAGFVWNENRPVPIRLHGSLRAALPKYFISACSKARMFRLRCYVLYGLVISEWLTGALKDAPTFRLRFYVLYGLIISEWLALHALYA